MASEWADLGHFRSSNAPASLKLVVPHDLDAVRQAFPEQQCSGLIEAKEEYRGGGLNPSFPEQQCSGLIEAVRCVGPNKKGFIISGAAMLRPHRSQCSHAVNHSISMYFRNSNAPASLKHHGPHHRRKRHRSPLLQGRGLRHGCATGNSRAGIPESVWICQADT